MPRDVMVVGGDLAGCATALSARRNGSRVHLVVQDARAPPDAEAFPSDVRERAAQWAERLPLPAPEPAEVFSFRARRVRRWLDELGVEPDATWPAYMHAALMERCEREGVGIDHDQTVIDLVHGRRGVSGAVLVDGQTADIAEADAVVVSTGDLAGLYEHGPTQDVPSGLALGTRAGLVAEGLEQIAFDGNVAVRGCGGFTIDGRGLTTMAGLYAVGPAAAGPWQADPALCFVEDVVRGLEAGSFEAPPGHGGDAKVPSGIDEPLADGFTQPKLERLRQMWTTAAGPDRDADTVRRAEIGIVQLRGEAMDYARTRVQGDVHLLAHACEAAVLGVRALALPSRGLHTLSGDTS